MPGAHESLDALAARLADGAAIDWAALAEDPALEPHVAPLQLLDRVVRGFRDVTIGDEEQAAFVWGPFRVHEQLGAGTFGEVYRAVDCRLDREVALKLRRQDTVDEIGAARVILDEARRLARVRHPNVVVVHGADVHDGRVGMWVDLVRGPSLAQQLETEPLTWKEAVSIGSTLAGALTAIHDAGLVHGDLKPANVLRDEDGTIRVADFGSAIEHVSRPRGVPRPGTGSHVGAASLATFATPVILAPELFEGELPAPATDIYALGALLFRALSGSYPVSGETVAAIRDAHRRNQRASLRLLCPDAPVRLIDVIERALSPSPARRFASARLMQEALASCAEPPSNLPHTLTRFVGREVDRAHVASQLEGGRLLTITGPGGVGKTRLALECSHDLLRHFRDGVFWVELAPVGPEMAVGPPVGSDRPTPGEREQHAAAVREQLGRRVARALSLPESPSRSVVESIATHVAPQEMLIVLDNCEHVIDAAAGLANELLVRCPELHILATSREDLRTAGEHILALDVLAVPSPQATDLETAERYDAISLFVDRARAVRPSFELDATNAPTVAGICRRLDGIPLAIELAAARVRTLTIDELATALDDRFRALAAGRRTDPARHRTLRALVQWSYDLLDAREKGTLEALSVFADGWSPEAAAAVVGAGDPTAVEDALARLIEKSLVQGVPGPETRQRLLDTIRDFAAERLRARGNELAVQRRLRDHLHALLRGLRDELMGSDPHRAIGAFQRERNNVLAVLEWCLEHDDERAPLAQFAVLLYRYWDRIGAYREAHGIFERLLSGPRDDDVIWGSILSAMGGVDVELRNLDSARRAHEEALEFYRSRGHELGVSTVLSNLAALELERSHPDEAYALAREGVDVARRIGDERRLATALLNFGTATQDVEEADQAYAEAIEIAEQGGHIADLGRLFFNRCRCARARGDEDTARRFAARAIEASRAAGALQDLALALAQHAELRPPAAAEVSNEIEEALAVGRRIDDPISTCYALSVRADLALREGELERAERALAEALRFAIQHRHPPGVFITFAQLGCLAQAREEWQNVAWRSAWSEACRARFAFGGLEPPVVRQARERAVAEARAALGDAAYRAAAAGIEALSPMEAAARALDELTAHLGAR